jgi:hypothetical protein
MKIFIICSKKFYDQVSPVKLELQRAGHIVSLPNCFDKPDTEEVYRNLGTKEHSVWKATMLRHSTDVINKNDAVLVLNFHKNAVKNYIGGATFLEMYDAFRLGKKIYLFNDIPEGILHDEIKGFEPIIIEKDLTRIS